MRVSKSRPWTSVPNQCRPSGGWNCASEMASGEYRASRGQNTTSTRSNVRKAELTTAGVFRWNRGHAGWFGVRGSVRTVGSLIFYPSVDLEVEQVNHLVQ